MVAGFGDRMQGVTGGERAVEEDGFVATAQHEDLLSQMLQSHLSGDFCLVGGRVGSVGYGKLWLRVVYIIICSRVMDSNHID